MVEIDSTGNSITKSFFKNLGIVPKLHKRSKSKSMTQSPTKSTTKVDQIKGSKIYGSPIKKKKQSRPTPSSNKHADNRKSAQRISLFHQDHVKILSGSLLTTSPTLNDFQNSSTSLLAMGPLEIYEIKTNCSCSKYMTIGKNGDIIHPLLPKLKITKIVKHNNSNDLNESYYISFSNPSRFWEIQFSQSLKGHENNEFEKVISQLCNLVYLEEPSEIVQEVHDIIFEDSPTINNEDDSGSDELNYLLEDSEEEVEDDIMDDMNQTTEKGSIRSHTTEFELGSTEINQEFRKVMNDILPPLKTFPDTNKWNWSQIRHNKSKKMTYRGSLYIPNTTVSSFDNHYNKLNRRSVSGLSDYDTLVSLHNLRL